MHSFSFICVIIKYKNVLCDFVLGSWILPLYSIVTYAAALKTVDFIVEGLDRDKCAVIITEHTAEICKVLGDTFGRCLF